MDLFEKQSDGRMGWEHKLDSFFGDLASDVKERFRERQEDKRGIEDQAEDFANVLDTRISMLKVLINSASEEEEEELEARSQNPFDVDPAAI